MKKLAFSKSIYKKRALVEAVNAFKEHMNCELRDNGSYFEVVVNSNAETLLMDEFSNYVLGATKKCL
ncbi:MAG: HxsD-like protein [Candidatus Omnitrophota bacterium]